MRHTQVFFYFWNFFNFAKPLNKYMYKKVFCKLTRIHTHNNNNAVLHDTVSVYDNLPNFIEFKLLRECKIFFQSFFLANDTFRCLPNLRN